MSAVWTQGASRAAPASAETTLRTIPFDYSFRFALTGRRGNAVRAKVTVSVEAAFTAVSMGYGVVPEVQTFDFGLEDLAVSASASSASAAAAARTTGAARVVAAAMASTGVAPPAASGIAATLGGARTMASLTGAATLPRIPIAAPVRDITFDEVFSGLEQAANALDKRAIARIFRDEPPIETALRAGIRINPRLLGVALYGKGGGLDAASLKEFFQVVIPAPRDVPFLYALFDEGSGREFQSEPVLSVAGLGAPDGSRPFRHFAQPITFGPLSTISMEVIEQSDVRGELFVSLHGYKILGGGSPAAASRDVPPRRHRRR